MLSDTLFDVIGKIEHYQKTMPQIYDKCKIEIEETKAQINKLREFLDGDNSPEIITNFDKFFKEE